MGFGFYTVIIAEAADAYRTREYIADSPDDAMRSLLTFRSMYGDRFTGQDGEYLTDFGFHVSIVRSI